MIGILEKINKFLQINEKVNKAKKLQLSNNEKNLIGSLDVHKETYRLDTTQSIYRYDKNITSFPFTGNENLIELKKLIKKISKK